MSCTHATMLTKYVRCNHPDVPYNLCTLGYCKRCSFNDDKMWPAQRDIILQRTHLGDKAESAIGHIPCVKKLPCYDENGKLKPDSGCGKRKRWANGEPNVYK